MNKKPFYKRWWFITLTTVVALVVAGLAWLFMDVRADMDTARNACREKITRHAKYESSVAFIEDTVSEVAKATDYGGVNYVVEGEVDMANGFGAPVRHTYWCHVGAHNGETGTPEVKIEEKQK